MKKIIFILFIISYLTVSGYCLNLAPSQPLSVNSDIEPLKQTVVISPTSSGYFQPLLKVDPEDVGKIANLFMLIQITNHSESYLLQSKNVTLDAVQKFTNLYEEIDFSTLAGHSYDVYFGYEVGSVIKYNFYRIVVPLNSVEFDNLSDFPINNIITMKFDKELQFTPVNSENANEEIPPGVKDLTKIENSDYIEVQNEDNGSQVDGDLYVSSDKKKLIFIPSQFLTPNKNYKIIVRKSIKFEDEETFGEDIVFVITTGSDENIALLTLPATSKVGKNVEMSIDTTIKTWHTLWDIDKDSEIDEKVEDSSNLSYTFNEAGIYRVGVEITDIYGRKYDIEKMINILPDMKQALEETNDLNLTNVQDISITDIDDNGLKKLLENFSDDVFSTVSGNILFDNGSVSSEKITAFSMSLNKINDFLTDYIKGNIDSNEFLGMVSLSGFPAILTYENKKVDNETLYNLKILMFDNGLDITNFHYKDYTIDCSFYDINLSPHLYFYSFEADNVTISDLKENLPKNIDNYLPTMVIEDDNITLYLYYTDNDSSFAWSCCSNISSDISHTYHKVKHVIKKVIHHGKKIIHKIIFKLTSIVSSDIISMLSNLKDFISIVTEISTSSLNDIKNATDNIKSSFENAKSQISNIENSITSNTDPDKFFKEVLGLVDENVNKNPEIKNFVDDVMKEINKTGSSINSFATIVNKVLSKSIDKGINEDLAVLFYIDSNKNPYFYIRKGHKHYNISLKTLLEMSKHISVVNKVLGNEFPLQDIINIIENLQKNFPAPVMIGYFYKGSGDHFTKFLVKYSKINEKKCSEDETSGVCFGVYAATSLDKNEIETGVNPTDDDGILVNFSPLSPLLPEIDGAGAVYDFIQQDIALFPKLSLNLRIKVDDAEFELDGSTFPELELEGIGEIGIDFDYYDILGGEGDAGVELGLVLNLTDLKKIGTEAVIDIVKSAYEAAKDVISSSDQNVQGSGSSQVSVIKFEDDDTFTLFINDFILKVVDSLKEKDLTELTKNIYIKLGIKGNIGLGAGEGGTGTGGIAGNIRLGINSGMIANLYLFQKFIDYIKDHDIDIFFLTPYYRMGQLFNEAKDDFEDISANTFATQSVNLLKDTYTTMVDTVQSYESGAEDTLKDLLKLSADNFHFYIGATGSVKVMAVEQGDVTAKIVTGPKIHINMESIYNIIYEALASISPENKSTFAEYFDHKGIYPEIEVTFPVSGVISGGFDDAVELQLEGEAKGNFFKGTFSLVSDPSVDSNGDALVPPIVIKLSTDKKKLSLHDNATIKCNVKLNDGAENYKTTWYLNGKEVSSTGKFTINGKDIVDINDYTDKELKLENFKISGKLNISCLVKSYKMELDPKGGGFLQPLQPQEKEINKSFDSITLYISK